MPHSLVTGGAGFIGSHLAEALLARGDQVTIIDDLSTGCRANIAGFVENPRCAFVEGSVADADRLEELVSDADDVYHLAAAVGVALVADAPVFSIETNIGPTALVLDLLERRHRQGERVRFFLASTSEVYGKNPAEPWTEDADLVFGPTTRPRWAYGMSKAIDEYLALAHHKTGRLPVYVARFFNVVGPRQTGAYGMVLPRMVKSALAGEAVVVHDDGRQVRCFADVRDVVEVIQRLVDAPDAVGQVVNVGSDEPVSIRELAERVIEQVAMTFPERRRASIEYQSYAEAYSSDFEDVRVRVPSLQRLRALLPDFAPRYPLKETIRDVIAYVESTI